MHNQKFKQHYFGKYHSKIEDSLHQNLPSANSNYTSQLNKAIEYAVFSGGKRIRPILTLLGAELFTNKLEQIFPAAVAVEFIHTSSLIFDDLPCMDNASHRRGKTSLHENFGEGTAILAGIALLNSAYQLVFNDKKNPTDACLKAHTEMVECIGVMGMIGGQAVDLQIAQNNLNYPENSSDVEKVKNQKTSALMRLSLCLGAILVGADDSRLCKLKEFAKTLGEAYQLRDDLNDIQEDSKIFVNYRKTNSIEVVINESQIELKKKIESAKEILKNNFSDSDAKNALLEIVESLAVINID